MLSGSSDDQAKSTRVDGNGSTEQPSNFSDVDPAIAWGMVEASPDALVVTNAHGVIELVNSQAEKLFGYDRHEMLTMPVEMLLPESTARVHTAHRIRYRSAPDVRSMGSGLDLRARRGDGTEIPVEVSLSPLERDGDLHIIAAVRDISDRVAREAERRLIQQTIDAVHDGVFMFTADDSMHFTYVNRGAVEQVGYSHDELLTMSPLHITPEYTSTQFRELLAPLLDGTVPRVVVRTTHLRKDGHEVPVEVALDYPEASESSARRYVVALVRDITSSVKAAEQIERSDARFRAAFDDGPIPMTLTEVSPTADRVIVQANQAMADLLGYSVDELLGRQITDFGHPDDREADDSATNAQAEGAEDSFHARKRYLHKDGRVIWVQLHVQTLTREDDTITTIGMSVDITAEVERDRLRSQNRAALDALSEMRSSLLGEAPITGVLEQLCDRTRELLDAELVVLAQPDSNRALLNIVAHSGGRSTHPPQSFDLDATFRSVLDGDTWVSNAETSLGSILGPDVVSAMAIPVPSAGGGLLLCGRSAQQGPFDTHSVTLMTQFAATASASLEIDEVRRAKQRTELLEDRERIGRDMHDKVIGRLFASGMALQSAVGLVVDQNARNRLLDAIDEIDDSIKEIRNAIYGLQARVDWGKGARGDVLALAVEQAAQLGFEPSVALSGSMDDLPDSVLDNLLAATREALVNAAKYANATRVSIEVTSEPDQVQLKVQDNGVGFVAQAGPREDKTGNGLGNIVSRAQKLGGRASITSAPGEGTTLDWVVPLP